MDHRLQLLLLVTALANVTALVLFASVLRSIVQKMDDRAVKDTISSDRLEATVDRMEAAAKCVAEDLAATAESLRIAAEQRVTQGETLDRMESATQVVADNLQASVDRADATDETIPGKSADAALRTGDTPEAIHARQDKARNSGH